MWECLFGYVYFWWCSIQYFVTRNCLHVVCNDLRVHLCSVGFYSFLCFSVWWWVYVCCVVIVVEDCWLFESCWWFLRGEPVNVCSGSCACCLSCDPLSFICVSMGSIFVSVCRWCVFVSSVHPVIVRSAEFCLACNLFMFVFDMMGDRIVLAYSRMCLVIVLYVMMSVSLDFPHCVVVSAAFMMWIVYLAFCFCVVFWEG